MGDLRASSTNEQDTMAWLNSMTEMEVTCLKDLKDVLALGEFIAAITGKRVKTNKHTNLSSTIAQDNVGACKAAFNERIPDWKGPEFPVMAFFDQKNQTDHQTCYVFLQYCQANVKRAEKVKRAGECSNGEAPPAEEAAPAEEEAPAEEAARGRPRIDTAGRRDEKRAVDNPPNI